MSAGWCCGTLNYCGNLPVFHQVVILRTSCLEFVLSLATVYLCSIIFRVSLSGPSGVLSFLALNKQNEPFLSKAMQKLSAEYGPVIGLILLHRKFICVSSRQAAVDALSNTELLGRPKSFDFNLRTKGLIRGITFQKFVCTRLHYTIFVRYIT